MKLTFRFWGVAFAGILSFSNSSYAFRSTADPRALGAFLGEEDSISISNPRTHGDFKPRLTGTLGELNLKFEDRVLNWQGINSGNGFIQGWGSPIITIEEETNLQEIDSVLRQFVSQNREAFRVEAIDLRLDRNRTKFSGPYRYVTYSRVHRIEVEAYPVENAFITFRFKFGRLIEFTNYSFGEIGPEEMPRISEDDALQTAMEDIAYNPQHDRVVGKVIPVLQPFYDERGQIQFRFTYEVGLRKGGSGSLWNYSVSARDGRIVRLVNGIHTAGHVTAEVYPRLPGESLVQVPVSEANVHGAGRSGKTDTEGNYPFESDGAVAELSGTRALVKQNSSQVISQQAGADGEILFSAQQSLSENMAYVYVNRINQFVRNFIKSAPRATPSGTVDFLNSPMAVNTRVKDSVITSCNAWFDPESKTLNFLEADDKCEASSHISDIIFHEWGHGLDDAFGGIQDGAFSEGIGDFTAVLMTGDPAMAPGFIKGREGPLRNISGVKVYPKDRSRDPHAEGLIISGAWFETLQLMKKVYGEQDGRMKTANLFFKHLVSTDSYLDSYAGALTVDDDDGNLSNCTPNMCLLNVAFARRGLTPADPRCFSDETQAGLPACAASTVRPPRE